MYTREHLYIGGRWIAPSGKGMRTVPRSRLAEEIASDYMRKASIGDPRDQSIKIGQMTSAEHRDRVQGYIGIGIDEGAELLVGGTGRPDSVDTGYFVKPTVFVCEDPMILIAQEEIFGPVQVLIPHDGDADAIRRQLAGVARLPS